MGAISAFLQQQPWLWQVVGLLAAFLVLHLISLGVNRRWNKKPDDGRDNKEDGQPQEPEPRTESPTMVGFLEPAFVYLLYRLSMLSPGQRFRENVRVHGAWIDSLVLASTSASYLAAWNEWGSSLWLVAWVGVAGIVQQSLGTGLFRNPIRKRRKDPDPPSPRRVVLLSLMNWAELVALFALIYQHLRGPGSGKWLYGSLSTQMTLGHAEGSFGPDEKFAVVAQCVVTFILVTTLVSRYMSVVSGEVGAKAK